MLLFFCADSGSGGQRRSSGTFNIDLILIRRSEIITLISRSSRSLPHCHEQHTHTHTHTAHMCVMTRTDSGPSVRAAYSFTKTHAHTQWCVYAAELPVNGGALGLNTGSVCWPR